MDGHFVPNLTIGPPVVASLRRHTGLFFDCHLMMTDPGDFLEAFRHAGADGCTVHVEVGDTAALLAQMRKSLGLRAGLAVNPDTPFEAIDPFLAEVDLILCMTVIPGFGGQSFMAEVLPKIARTRGRARPARPGRRRSRSTGASTRTPPVAVVRAGAPTSSWPARPSSPPSDPWEAARRHPPGGRESPARGPGDEAK